MKNKIGSLFIIVLIFISLSSATCFRDAFRATCALDNSRSKLDWDGVYTGIIPSASGSGIQVRIVLNKDNSFVMQYYYIDRDGADFTQSGTFSWNEDGSVITLDTESIPPYYQVGENFLRQLDLQGNIITGNLAENYVLGKVKQ